MLKLKLFKFEKYLNFKNTKEKETTEKMKK
jgi:hypothetical protein